MAEIENVDGEFTNSTGSHTLVVQLGRKPQDTSVLVAEIRITSSEQNGEDSGWMRINQQQVWQLIQALQNYFPSEPMQANSGQILDSPDF